MNAHHDIIVIGGGRAGLAVGHHLARDDRDTLVGSSPRKARHAGVRLHPRDPAGRIIHRRGITASPGLFFVGLPWEHTRGSALLGWIRHDAQFIARAIARTPVREAEAVA